LCAFVSSSVAHWQALQWWRARRGEYPILSRMARKYLGVPATSVPCERTFSTAGNIVMKKRCSLSPYQVRVLCFLHANRAVLDGILSDLARSQPLASAAPLAEADESDDE